MHQNLTSGEIISREIFEISKKNVVVLKLFLRPILFHGKISFDNLTYFKLYGNLNQYDVIPELHTAKTSNWQLSFNQFQFYHFRHHYMTGRSSSELMRLKEDRVREARVR